ncbi:MAG: hypothetical protein Q8S00_01975, partial [Deltaproteobacteria bacterium]|nr:hypothetical protein [Deltaproteobacteria bacterium]
DAVRVAAHKAVQVHSRGVDAGWRRLGSRRWRAPLALAATVLLAVGIVIRVYNTGEMELVPPQAPPATQNVQEEPGAEKKAERLQPGLKEERRASGARGALSRREAPRSSGETASRGDEIAGKAGAFGKDAAPPVGSTDNVERKSSAENSTAQAVQTEAPVERQEAQPAPKAFPGAPNAVPGARPVPEPAAVQRDLAPRKIPEAPPADLRDSPSRGQFERQADKAVADPAMPVPLLSKRLEGRSPEVWIEEIRGLKRAARGAEAAELLAAFRKKFPNFLLPDDLK